MASIEEFCGSSYGIREKCNSMINDHDFVCPDFTKSNWIPIEEDHHIGEKHVRWEQCHDCGARMFKQVLTSQQYIEMGYPTGQYDPNADQQNNQPHHGEMGDPSFMEADWDSTDSDDPCDVPDSCPSESRKLRGA